MVGRPVLSVISGMALAGAAGASGDALRLSCTAPAKADAAGVAALCRALGDGVAARTGRGVAIVEHGADVAADVALEVVEFGAQRVTARLVWAGQGPGKVLELGVVDGPFSEGAFASLAAGLLRVSPPP